MFNIILDRNSEANKERHKIVIYLQPGLQQIQNSNNNT